MLWLVPGLGVISGGHQIPRALCTSFAIAHSRYYTGGAVSHDSTVLVKAPVAYDYITSHGEINPSSLPGWHKCSNQQKLALPFCEVCQTSGQTDGASQADFLPSVCYYPPHGTRCTRIDTFRM